MFFTRTVKPNHKGVELQPETMFLRDYPGEEGLFAKIRIADEYIKGG
jgi:hypothetical protein